MVVRAAAKRWIRLSDARIQPVRMPAQWDLLSDPMETTAGLKEASGAVVAAVEVQLTERFIHHQDCAGRGGGADQPAALGVGHQPAGGVVEVRDDVGHRGGAASARIRSTSRSQPRSDAGGRATGTIRQPVARMASSAFG